MYTSRSGSRKQNSFREKDVYDSPEFCVVKAALETALQLHCPACESAAVKQAFVKNGYEHYSCRACAGLFVWPRPSEHEAGGYYQDNFRSLGSSLCWDNGLDGPSHVLPLWRSLLGSLEHRGGKGPLLDMGCGTGAFLSCAKSLGWHDLTGVEIVREAAQTAQKLEGAKVYNEDFLSVQLPEQHFSAAALLDVIEHAADAENLLARIFGLLRPGGFLVLGTPNRRGLSMRLLGRRALMVCPPEHLTLFSRTGISRLLSRTGFRIERQLSVSLHLREWLGFLLPALSSRDRDVEYRRLKSGFSNTRIFIAAMKAADIFLNASDLGDQIYILAQKPVEGP